MNQMIQEELATTVGSLDAVQGIYADVATQEFVVHMVGDASQRTSTHLQQVAGDFNLRVESFDSPLRDTDVIRGGVALGGCTAAFTAISGSTVGFYTAAHCGASQSYWDTTASTGATSGTSTRRSQTYNANADIAYHSVSGNSIARSFYGSSATSATATGGPQNVGVGAYICRRGRTTGYHCGSVSSISYTPTYSGACPGGACNPTFISVPVGTQGGDSGGPWFNGAHPIGIHKGGNATNLSICSKLQYSPSGTSLY